MPVLEAPPVTDTKDTFDLDISEVELTDGGGLVQVTDDNCGSTCSGTACITHNG